MISQSFIAYTMQAQDFYAKLACREWGWRASKKEGPDLAFPANSCYTGTVTYACGADKMKLTGSRTQGGQRTSRGTGTDLLTTSLVWLAFFLAATIAALAADLWLRPANGSPALQAFAPGPASLVLAMPYGLAPASNPSPQPAPSPTAKTYPAPVRIRIPAIGVDRSIVEVPLVYDAHTGTWERDYEQLFRQGKRDLVGHQSGSAAPGEPGNTILVGHNYGYGVNGVFLRLGRLKPGQAVEVVNASGETFAYLVTEVKSVSWTTKDQRQLLEHQQFLSVQGAERLTLVTCGGSRWAPFPKRVYVVASPVQ